MSGPFPLLGCQIDLAAWISYASLGRSQHEHEESSEIKCRTRLSYHRKHARNRFISTSFTSSTRGTMEATRRDIICDSLSRGDTSRIKHYASAKLHFRLGWRKNARNVLTMYSTCSGRAGCRAASSSIAKLGMAADPRDLLPCSYQNASFSQAGLHSSLYGRREDAFDGYGPLHIRSGRKEPLYSTREYFHSCRHVCIVHTLGNHGETSPQ